ncbi:beta-defensin 105 isoform X2 [Lemur catta]|uniref:beta-defensin 105 isoform X2 n=1 Tax=Lemur catta TaxID=9447 RepID=UPI001E26DE1F|nr:beta-defensin 105 isoform X2 [Lemur catta]
MSLLFSQRNPKRLSKESSTKMALSRKTLYFVFAFFFTLAQLPSGCQAGMDYPYSFPGGQPLRLHPQLSPGSPTAGAAPASLTCPWFPPHDAVVGVPAAAIFRVASSLHLCVSSFSNNSWSAAHIQFSPWNDLVHVHASEPHKVGFQWLCPDVTFLKTLWGSAYSCRRHRSCTLTWSQSSLSLSLILSSLLPWLPFRSFPSNVPLFPETPSPS